jgi:hypothetical protein
MSILKKLVNAEQSFWVWYNRPVDCGTPMPEPPSDDAFIAFFCVFLPALFIAAVCIARRL